MKTWTPAKQTTWTTKAEIPGRAGAPESTQAEVWILGRSRSRESTVRSAQEQIKTYEGVAVDQMSAMMLVLKYNEIDWNMFSGYTSL